MSEISRVCPVIRLVIPIGGIALTGLSISAGIQIDEHIRFVNQEAEKVASAKVQKPSVEETEISRRVLVLGDRLESVSLSYLKPAEWERLGTLAEKMQSLRTDKVFTDAKDALKREEDWNKANDDKKSEYFWYSFSGIGLAASFIGGVIGSAVTLAIGAGAIIDFRYSKVTPVS